MSYSFTLSKIPFFNDTLDGCIHCGVKALQDRAVVIAGALRAVLQVAPQLAHRSDQPLAVGVDFARIFLNWTQTAVEIGFHLSHPVPFC
jgi:hypothetical protein